MSGIHVGGELVGRYRVEGRIGRGGMGEVFKALDLQLDRWVAIKSIPGAIASIPARRKQLIQEARTVAALNHPAIAQIHDVVSDDGCEYLVFEYAEGCNLAEVLDTGRPGLETSVRLARDIADGLQAAHAAGVIHRDLKAENVIVSPSGRAEILDFGLAVMTSNGEAPAKRPGSGIAGTASAMSPEQAEGDPVDQRSDLFSLGTLMYQMLAGEHPFRGGSPIETVQRIVKESPPPLRKLDPRMPRSLSRIVERLLSKAPDDRPASASEVVQVLDRVLARLDPERGARGRRLLVTSGAALVFLAAGVGLWRLTTSQAPLEPVHVAVLESETDGEDPMARLDVVAAAVRMAAMNTLAELEGVFPINAREVDGAEGTPSEVAHAVAADEVVTATVVGTGTSTMVTLGRVDGKDGHSRWVGTFEVPGDNLQLLADTVTAHLRQGYGERRARPGAFEVVASAEDYEAYLRIRRKVYDPPEGVSWPSVLEELAAIRKSSPRLLNVYSLESSVARYLFMDTRDERYRAYAQEVIDDAMSIAPGDQRTLLAAVDLALATGDLDKAGTSLDEAQRLVPSNPVGLTYRARLMERAGEVDDALVLLGEVAAARPSWWYLLTLAQMEQRQGQFSSARTHLIRARTRVPGSIAVAAELARVELLYGDMEQAEELFLELIGGSPQPRYLTGLGAAQLFLGSYAEAAESFERAYELGSRSPETMLNLADVYSLQGEDAISREWYRRVLDGLEATGVLGPEDHGMKAQCLAQLGRHEEAVATLRHALAQAPRSAQVAYGAALVFALVGDIESSDKYVRKALRDGIAPSWFSLPWFDGSRDTVAAASRDSGEPVSH